MFSLKQLYGISKVVGCILEVLTLLLTPQASFSKPIFLDLTLLTILYIVNGGECLQAGSSDGCLSQAVVGGVSKMSCSRSTS